MKINGKIQCDHKVRMVALANLNAMCKRASSVCHRYWIEKVTANRVHVCYSNPNEYGSEDTQTAVFPCYPNQWNENDNPFVVLSILRVINDYKDGQGWQNFHPITDGEELFRSNPDTEDWKTRKEWEQCQ